MYLHPLCYLTVIRWQGQEWVFSVVDEEKVTWILRCFFKVTPLIRGRTGNSDQIISSSVRQLFQRILLLGSTWHRNLCSFFLGVREGCREYVFVECGGGERRKKKQNLLCSPILRLTYERRMRFVKERVKHHLKSFGWSLRTQKRKFIKRRNKNLVMQQCY